MTLFFAKATSLIFTTCLTTLMFPLFATIGPFADTASLPSKDLNSHPLASKPIFDQNTIMVDLSDLTPEQFFEGYLDREETALIIRCQKGSRLVVNFDVDNRYFHAGDKLGNGSSIAFTIDELFYTRNAWIEEAFVFIDEEGHEIHSTHYYVEPYFSEDLETWQKGREFFGFSIDLQYIAAIPNTLYFSLAKKPAETPSKQDSSF